MRDSVERAEHNWQQSEHNKHTGENVRDLVAQDKHNWQQPEHNKCMSERNKDMVVRGEHPGQKQLDKIYCVSKSTCWIDLWNKDGTIHTQMWIGERRRQTNRNR
jgi:hypothetical protein